MQIESLRLQKYIYVDLQHLYHKTKKIPNFIVEAQLGHKMNIKENLMIPENIRILESFKILES
jgi:hypothetical protein